MELTCPSCKNRISPENYFCPRCGKKLRQQPLSTSFAKQFGVYALSVLCPPFGLVPAFRYIQQPNRKSIMVGCVAIALTMISLIVVTYFTLTSLAMFLPLLDYAPLLEYAPGFGQ